jgi:hypothetical protein
MGFLDLFRRKAPIRDGAAIATFVDENAAFLMQKGLYEYSRARAGHYAKVLFGEPEFHAAIEAARWRAYPLGLAIVAEAVEGVLSERLDGERGKVLQTLNEQVLAAFDRYPPPEALGTDEWRNLRSELSRRLQLIGLHPPKRIIDIPEQWARAYFDLMPVHEKLRGRDFHTTRNYLRVMLCNIHDEFGKRLDPQAVAASFEAAEMA